MHLQNVYNWLYSTLFWLCVIQVCSVGGSLYHNDRCWNTTEKWFCCSEQQSPVHRNSEIIKGTFWQISYWKTKNKQGTLNLFPTFNAKLAGIFETSIIWCKEEIQLVATVHKTNFDTPKQHKVSLLHGFSGGYKHSGWSFYTPGRNFLRLWVPRWILSTLFILKAFPDSWHLLSLRSKL